MSSGPDADAQYRRNLANSNILLQSFDSDDNKDDLTKKWTSTPLGTLKRSVLLQRNM